jgi:hypothetical protein
MYIKIYTSNSIQNSIINQSRINTEFIDMCLHIAHVARILPYFLSSTIGWLLEPKILNCVAIA